jgi:hypothetical protein
LYKASQAAESNKNAAQQISIPNSSRKFKMHVYLFISAQKKQQQNDSFHHPFRLPLRACIRRKFGVYMIYEFKMKREWN